ncbi:MAG: type IIL restriction-modification enzyme MmeI [Burkholderiaceae bacterium]
MGYLDPEVICGDANMCVPEASVFHFGILSSTMHNAWVRAVCGRLKSDFRYSAAIVYNNFPGPSVPRIQNKSGSSPGAAGAGSYRKRSAGGAGRTRRVPRQQPG